MGSYAPWSLGFLDNVGFVCKVRNVVFEGLMNKKEVGQQKKTQKKHGICDMSYVFIVDIF